MLESILMTGAISMSNEEKETLITILTLILALVGMTVEV